MGAVSKNMSFGSIAASQPSSSAGNSRPASAAGSQSAAPAAAPVSKPTEVNSSNATATAAVPKTIPKLDFNSFFQGGGGSPNSSPTRETVPSSNATQSQQALHASVSSTLAGNGLSTNQQSSASGPSSRRASTYDNSPAAALSPRMMAAQLPHQGQQQQLYPPQQGGPAGRSFSPGIVAGPGGKVGQAAGLHASQGYQSPYGGGGLPQSPSFAPQPYGQQTAYSGSPYMKPNGLPVNGQPGANQNAQGGQQQVQSRGPPGTAGGPVTGQPPYIGRNASAMGHPHARPLQPNSPRGTPGQPMQAPGQYYAGYPSGQPGWYPHQASGGYYPYPGAPYPPAAYYSQQAGQQQQQTQGQPNRPGLMSGQQSQLGQSGTPSSPAPSLRPTLSAASSGTWTPGASTATQPGTESTGATPAPSTSSPTLSHASIPPSAAGASQFRPSPLHTHPSTPSHGQHPSISQALHHGAGPSTPSHFTPHSAQAPAFTPSNMASPMTPGQTASLNAGAQTFNFTGQRPAAPFIPLSKPPSKALQIKKPPPKETAASPSPVPAAVAASSSASGEADKEKADKDAEQKRVVDEKAKKEAAEQKDKEEAEARAKADADAAAAAEKAKKDREEKEAAEKAEQEKAELEKKLREQEEEAKRVREAKEAEEKAAREKEEAEKKAKAEEEAAIAAAAAEKKRLEEEKAAADAAAAAAAASSTSSSADTSKTSDEQPASSAPLSRRPSSQASTEEPSAPATPAGEDATQPAGPAGKKGAPEPLDLSSATAKQVVSTESIVAPGSALSHAKIIEDLSVVPYPDSIKSPQPELNAKAKPGKFRYDREFLLQFMDVCKEKPEQLPSLEAIGMTDEGPGGSAGGVPIPRSASYGGKSRTGSVPSTPMAARGGVPPNLNRAVSSGFAGMGNFSGLPASNLTSEQRFAAATAAASTNLPGRPGGAMARAPSMGSGFGGIPMGGPSGRGMDRNSGRGRRRNADRGPPPASSTLLPSDIAPLEISENRWTPTVQASGPARLGGAPVDETAPEYVERKVKALLNKLTIDNFDSISNQILEWANKSSKETDGRILKQVIALIFEKATDEQTWSEVYAKLCQFLCFKVSPDVADHSLLEATGQPCCGGKLFRRYLLTRCQHDYEQGWAQKESATAAAKSKAADDQAKREAAEKEGEAAGVDKETAVKGVDFSDEYYAAEKAKRRGLGLVRFIGELYKLQMLREKMLVHLLHFRTSALNPLWRRLRACMLISSSFSLNSMHECIKKLIANPASPEEEDIESLCKLLFTVGKQLEEGKDQNAAKYMDIYFTRLQMVIDKHSVSSRLEFMILDLMDTRRNGWKQRTAATGPKSIAQIHRDTQREKEEEARRTTSQGRGLPPRNIGMERGGSRRGQGREGPGADGWQATAPPRPQRAGDLASLGKIRSTSGSPALMPGRAGKMAAKEESPAPSTRAANPFELLAGGEEAGVSELSPPAEEKPQRVPLKLAPRTVDANAGASGAEGAPSSPRQSQQAGGADEDEEEGEVAEGDSAKMDESTKRSIDNSVKEYLGVRNIDEGKETFSALPERFRGELAKAFIVKVVDGKAQDVEAVAKLFEAISEASLVPQTAFRDAFVPTVTDLEDIATDAPKAFNNVADLMAAADLSEEDVQHLQQAMVSNEDDLEGIQSRLMECYQRASSD